MPIQSILKLINQYQLADAFAAIDKLGVQDAAYARLKKEFISGAARTDVDFIDRLKMMVNTLEIPKTLTQPKNMTSQSIKNLIGDNKITEAIKELTLIAENSEDKDFDNKVLNLSRRYKKNENSNNMGLLSYSDYLLEGAKIINSLLQLCDDLPNNDSKSNISVQGNGNIVLDNIKDSSIHIHTRSNPDPDNKTDTPQRDLASKEKKPTRQTLITVEKDADARDFIPFKNIKTNIKILFLAAGTLNTGKESRFKDLIKYFDEEKRFDFKEQHGVTPEQFQNFLVMEDPHIVHYGGHGHQKGIVLEGNDLDAAVLTEILAFSENTQCVILNACNTQPIAEAIARHIPYVVATQDRIDDRAAIAFARGFYMGIVAGKTIETAFKNGVLSIKREKLPDADVPILVKGVGKK
jgi:Effector-associated domain 11/CHAT domain